MISKTVSVAVALTAVGVIAACSSGERVTTSPSSAPTIAVAAEAADQPRTAPTTAVSASTTTIVATPSTSDDSPSTSEATTVPDDPPPPCRRLTDFEVDDENRQWLVVNDNVMGGQSLGDLSFEDGRLVFAGEINTDGGGFSSLRLPLESGTLGSSDRVVFRARPDDRSYMVTFDDAVATRDRRVSHRAPIAFDRPGEWQTVSVAFEDLFPAIFGQPIDDLPFQADLANRMGLMISDGLDGPFRLEVDWIDLCAPTPEE